MSTTDVRRDADFDHGPVRSGPGRGRWGRMVHSPLGWALAGLVGVGLVAGVTATGPGPVPVLGGGVAVGVYWVVMRRLARRATPEITGRGAARQALLGSAMGLGFVAVSTLLIVAFGGYSFSWAHHAVGGTLASVLAVQAGAALTEELMFRGVALQAIEQRWGTVVAVAVTALFFGAVHMANPGATLWSGMAIAVEAGVMLGAAFLWQRSIWLVVGLHFVWNSVEQLLGVPVSGHPADARLLNVRTSGSHLLTGGAFGLEASVVPVAISLLLAIPMFVAARRRGNVLPARRADRRSR
ncbi:Abortive infection protein [Catenulispora acidiphila DSM 44928]|uniref:Abortive infection protein n=1 Tax=Catenulispora acidiphila (strain DSM 44928 / JCM 14897 / NBRC 102108 / NRRL B-24433 / ID139908) TaxID=479433 RepID=C7Q9S4_CATAD|nr:Abortive infection protein [Catenulispora acidiphila DSM 44928]